MRFLLITLTVLFLLTSQDLMGQDLVTPNLTKQDRKGQFWVDGALGTFFDEDFSFNRANSEVGYFFHDRILIGVGLGASWGDEVLGAFINSTQLAPFARFYFSSGEWRPYGEARFNFVLAKDEETEALPELSLGLEKELMPGVLASAALTYRFNSAFAPDLQLGAKFNALLGGYDTQGAAAERLTKGSWNMGNNPINLSYARRSRSDINFYGVRLNPEFAYFLTDKLMLDGSVDLDYFNSNINFTGSTASSNTTNSLDYSLGLGLRRYFNNRQRVNFFAQAGLEFLGESVNSRSVQTGGGEEEFTFSSSQLNANLALGGTFFLNNYASIDFGFRGEQIVTASNTGPSGSVFIAFRFWGKK